MRVSRGVVPGCARALSPRNKGLLVFAERALQGLLGIPHVALPEGKDLPDWRGGAVLRGAHNIRHRAGAASDDTEALAVLHLPDACAALGDVARVRHHDFDVRVRVVLADVARVGAPRGDVRRELLARAAAVEPAPPG